MSPLAEPAGDLRAFPALRLAPARPLYRIHRREHGPWWFSCDGTGRFDLKEPGGACYLALDPAGAFVEVFREIAQISQALVDGRRLSTLRVPRVVRLADCTSARARAFGLTAEVHGAGDYEVTQRWAAGLVAADFAGIHYYARHDPSQRSLAVALFGLAGEATWPVASTEPISPELTNQVRRRFGIHVLPTP